MKIIMHLFLLLLISNQLFAQNRIIKGVVYSVDTNWTNISKKEFSVIDTNLSIGATICFIKDKDLKPAKKKQKCKHGTQADFDGHFGIEYDSLYTYMEVSNYNMKPKLQKISEIPDSGITIFLTEPLSILDKINIVTAYKPAIYLYPTIETNISIKHDFKGQIGTTYPDYKNGWNVIAQPNGALLNIVDKRTYEYLFWDGTCTFPDEHFNFKDGFVIQKENLNEFLLEKLTLIGFNNKEINDFIVYWLPILNKNETSFIHFRINDDIDNTSFLHVAPKPDSRIRLFMEYKKVDSDFTIPEQQLKNYSRMGFTLVEWGGGKIEHLTKIF